MPNGRTDGAAVARAETSSATTDFERSVRSGLSARPKTLEAKYFYDEAGSVLFDRITELPEYYLTKAETEILASRAGEIADLVGPDAELVELGSGASIKTRLLLAALTRPANYIPIDISAEHMAAAADGLQALHPDLAIHPVAADFMQPLRLPERSTAGRRLLFFPGSTIGNLEPTEARLFLDRVRRETGADLMIIGADLAKDRATLEAAYNDGAGVTAAFNLNLLTRINRELGGDFAIDSFRHEARYNQAAGRIEMHLVSLVDQTVAIGDFSVALEAGETIHSENSYKYTIAGFHQMVGLGGWRPQQVWTDAQGRFSVHLLAPD